MSGYRGERTGGNRLSDCERYKKRSYRERVFGKSRLLPETIGPLERTANLLMDRAYDDRTRFQAWRLRFYPIVPPKGNRVKGWEYDEELYKRLNGVERLFRLLKSFLSVFTRYEELYRMFAAFVFLAIETVIYRAGIWEDQREPAIGGEI